jgi:hypothetical protein
MVKRKHTVNGEARFSTAIAEAVASLGQFRVMEAERIKRMMWTELDDELADALILRAFEKGIINSHQLPHVLREWRQPTFDEFEERTAWSLFNAFTTILGRKAVGQPQAHALQTMRLNSLIVPQALATEARYELAT